MSDFPLSSKPSAPHKLRLALFGLTIATLSATTLMGCQPKANSETAVQAEHAADEEHAHKEHDSEAHTEMAHEEEHNEHAHEEHAHEENNDEAHDDHGDHEEHDDHAGHDHAGHDHDAGRIQYDCKSSDNATKKIGAFYHEDAEPKSAHLLIDGIEYDMYQIGSEADSSNNYGTEIGINEGQGMRWTRNGHEAVLSTITLDDSASPDDEAVLYTCHEAK